MGQPCELHNRPKHDLLLVLLAVTVVTEGSQGAHPALKVGTRHVVEDQGRILQVAPGQDPLDPALAPEQPVEHGEHLVAGDRPQGQQGTETAGGGLR